LQILILLSAMIASLTGLVTGERAVVRAQVERSVAPRSNGTQAEAARSGVRADAANPRKCQKGCAPEARPGPAPAAPARGSRSILLLKRAWLE
jgi:hypothetical protein